MQESPKPGTNTPSLPKSPGEEGYHYIAKLFEETAENEKQHALDHFKMLNGLGRHP